MRLLLENPKKKNPGETSKLLILNISQPYLEHYGHERQHKNCVFHCFSLLLAEIQNKKNRSIIFDFGTDEHTPNFSFATQKLSQVATVHTYIHRQKGKHGVTRVKPKYIATLGIS